MSYIDTLGYIGTVFLVSSLLPQIYKTYKTKKHDDISFLYLIFQIFTCIILMTYTILIDSMPLIISNACILVEIFALIYFKFKYKNYLDPNTHINLDLKITSV